MLAGCDVVDQDGLFHCQQSIQNQFPAPGTPNAFGAGWIVIDLNCPAHQPRLEVQPQQGAAWELPVELAQDGRQLRARPAIALSPEARFLLELNDEPLREAWLLLTNSLGGPLSYDLGGHSEELLLDQGRLLSPQSLEPTLLDRLSAVRPVISFLNSGSSTTVPVRIGGLQNETEQQDPDWPTSDHNLDWAAPYFSGRAIELRLPLASWDLIIEDVQLEGAPHPVQGGIGSISIQGLWDTRGADPALGGSPGALCQFAEEQQGMACQACGDGVLACLDLLLVDIPTQRWPDALAPG
tara:strand:+ start:1659 stop:2546 length:888 start_codon:yes stop_codon:yes gene_type:complete